MNEIRERVLIVDDDPSVIDLLGNVLDSDYDLVIATSGEEALELVAQNTQFELILLDIILPKMDGFQVIEKFKNLPTICDIPVIFITAGEDKKCESKGLNSGAVDFISKPISPLVVLARVKTHLALYQQKLELEKKQYEIEHSEALLRATLESSKDGIVVLDENYKVSIYNKRFIELWKIPEELIETGEFKSLLDQYLKQLIKSEEGVSNIDEFLRSKSMKNDILEFKDGRVFSRYSMPLAYENGEKGRVFNYTDITEFRDMESELRKLSLTDDLTGLYNRRKMDEILTRENIRSKRYGYNVGLLIMDIDYFKEINDTYGHKMGDKVLVSISSKMKNHFRSVDYCCRYGGDEFIVIIPNSSIGGVIDAGERFLNLINAELIGGLHVKMSIGAASTHLIDGDKNSDILISLADQALYQAKKSGRNCIHFYQEEKEN